MSDPLVFDSKTARLELPLLYSGQAQKEVFVNESLGRIDALAHCTVEGTASSAPASPVNGQAWLIDTAPTGEWLGHAGSIAFRQAGQWLFIDLFEGLRVTNRQTGQDMRWLAGAWKAPTMPAMPTTGAVVDAELRAVMQALLVRLQEAGVFAQ